MIKTVIASQEVEENRCLSLSESEHYRLANTALIPCSKDHGCNKMLEVFAKDANFTSWSCSEYK